MSIEDLQHWRDWQSNSGIEQQQMIRLVLQDTDITNASSRTNYYSGAET